VEWAQITGGWGFIGWGKIWKIRFFGALTVKNGYFIIQTTIFEFK
jgi:hypothetical protein